MESNFAILKKYNNKSNKTSSKNKKLGVLDSGTSKLCGGEEVQTGDNDNKEINNDTM